MSKVMFSLPDRLVVRMRTHIPARERSKIIVRLLEKELDNREQDLHQRAMQLEALNGLKDEATGWDTEFGGDGLEHV